MFPDKKYPSPSGAYVFHISAWEARMSHWIESFTLLETEGDKVIFRPKDSNWSLDSAAWAGEAVVKMQLRKYPGDHEPAFFEVTIDCITHTARIESEAAIAVTQLDQALEALYRRS